MDAFIEDIKTIKDNPAHFFRLDRALALKNIFETVAVGLGVVACTIVASKFIDSFNVSALSVAIPAIYAGGLARISKIKSESDKEGYPYKRYFYDALYPGPERTGRQTSFTTALCTSAAFYTGLAASAGVAVYGVATGISNGSIMALGLGVCFGWAGAVVSAIGGGTIIGGIIAPLAHGTGGLMKDFVVAAIGPRELKKTEGHSCATKLIENKPEPPRGPM